MRVTENNSTDGCDSRLKATEQMTEDKTIESIQINGQKKFKGATQMKSNHRDFKRIATQSTPLL